MMHHYLSLSRLVLAGTLLLLLAGCSSPSSDEPLLFSSKRPVGEAEAPVKQVPADVLAAQRAFTAVSRQVTPSVVNISTLGRRKLVRPMPDFPSFFDDFFGGPQVRQNRSLGSGFIISRDGFIVTNEHVIRDAESIQVKLSSNKVYQAKVVGGDPKTDIAVIKIEASDLPVSVLGDSDRIEVGQWAIAIGNPFGLEHSMTVGVISATGRSNVGIETIENFIQTDASINPGNSGGPLLNIHGEVVGINTAIVASGQGIGFAIPTSMAKPIIAQLVEKGSVTRAWLGVGIRPVSAEEANRLGQENGEGTLITELAPGGPAERGGLQPEDLLVEFGGSPVKDPSHLQRLVAEARIGKPVQVKVLRSGRPLALTLVPANADEARPLRSSGPGRLSR